MQKTVINETVKHDLCINCGMCKIVCPHSAIELKPNWCGEYTPSINIEECVNCGICSTYCPNTKKKLKDEATKISGILDAQTFGLENASYYAAWSNDRELRQKCCSGGIVTEFAKYLFENNLIDGMIHVERIWANRGELHYGARLSSSLEEIVQNVSSAYQPIDFSQVLQSIDETKVYFITGTPCVIRVIKKLFSEHKKYKKIKILTCALVCSHNTNAQFIDFLTEINELDDNEKWKVNIRQKDDNIIDANNFNNHIYTKTFDLLKKK